MGYDWRRKLKARDTVSSWWPGKPYKPLFRLSVWVWKLKAITIKAAGKLNIIFYRKSKFRLPISVIFSLKMLSYYYNSQKLFCLKIFAIILSILLLQMKVANLYMSWLCLCELSFAFYCCCPVYHQTPRWANIVFQE